MHTKNDHLLILYRNFYEKSTDFRKKLWDFGTNNFREYNLHGPTGDKAARDSQVAGWNVVIGYVFVHFIAESIQKFTFFENF